ncbi:hypothetical protein FRB90_010435, partial [Tulasnella sp. 427]
NQYILAANSQALIVITVTPLQSSPRIPQNLALTSVVATLFAIVAAMACSSTERHGDAETAPSGTPIDRAIKMAAFGMTVVAFVLFVTAIVSIKGGQ